MDKDKEHPLRLLLRSRKVMFINLLAGLRGDARRVRTLDRLFEALTLIQTRKIGRFPIILVGRSYWAGLMDWVRQVMGEENGNISPGTWTWSSWWTRRKRRWRAMMPSTAITC